MKPALLKVPQREVGEQRIRVVHPPPQLSAALVQTFQVIPRLHRLVDETVHLIFVAKRTDDSHLCCHPVFGAVPQHDAVSAHPVRSWWTTRLHLRLRLQLRHLILLIFLLLLLQQGLPTRWCWRQRGCCGGHRCWRWRSRAVKCATSLPTSHNARCARSCLRAVSRLARSARSSVAHEPSPPHHAMWPTPQPTSSAMVKQELLRSTGQNSCTDP